MNYFKNELNEVFAYDDEQIKQGLGEDLTSITEEEMKALTTFSKTEEQIVAEYKTYYQEIFNSKLSELDYDGIETVTFWASKSGSEYNVEANSLADWYESIINKNYEILNAVKAGTRTQPTKEEYLAELPQYATFEI